MFTWKFIICGTCKKLYNSLWNLSSSILLNFNYLNFCQTLKKGKIPDSSAIAFYVTLIEFKITSFKNYHFKGLLYLKIVQVILAQSSIIFTSYTFTIFKKFAYKFFTFYISSGFLTAVFTFLLSYLKLTYYH